MIAGVHLEFLAQSSLRVSVFVQWVWTYVLVSEARRASWIPGRRSKRKQMPMRRFCIAESCRWIVI